MMRKTLTLSFVLLISLLFSLFLTTNTVFAAECPPSCCCDSAFIYDPGQPKGLRCVSSRGVYVPHRPVNCPDMYCIPGGEARRGICSATPGPGIQPETCIVGGEYKGGVKTALGCIPTKDPTQFVAWLLARGIGIAGGIAFLLMIFATFQITTSSGDPQKLQGGKELLTSAIAGLLLIIFSLFLLRLIGVRILEIPGFG